jgi:hypothetical protein
MKKKFTPASICSQQKWQGFPVSKKNTLRKMLPDKDKDGVPNRYDCHPQNRMRQEGFSKEDKAYLASNPKIKRGKFINKGSCGAVYSVQGHPDLVVKVPTARIYEDCKDMSIEKKYRSWCGHRSNLENEGSFCTDNDTNSEPFFIPTKQVVVKKCKVYNCDCIGLVRPRVESLGCGKNVTDSQIAVLHDKLVELSYKGFAFKDGLQVGKDKSGRILQFDLDSIERDTPSNAFYYNDDAWRHFLFNVGKLHGYNSESQQHWLDRYGWITPGKT